MVGFGVIVAPLRLGLYLYQTCVPILTDDGTWEALTSSDSAAYNAFRAPLLIGEIIFTSIMILACLYLIYLFFKKHNLFPRMYIAIVLIKLVAVPADAWLVSLVVPDEPIFDPATLGQFFQTLVSAVIWVPYMFVSKRVKQTFVEGKPA